MSGFYPTTKKKPRIFLQVKILLILFVLCHPQNPNSQHNNSLTENNEQFVHKARHKKPMREKKVNFPKIEWSFPNEIKVIKKVLIFQTTF